MVPMRRRPGSVGSARLSFSGRSMTIQSVLSFICLAERWVLTLAVQKQHRGPSLVDAHEQAESRKNKDPSEGPPGIWDHSRDMATGGRLMDEKDRRKLINDSKDLSSRFGAGTSGGFL